MASGAGGPAVATDNVRAWRTLLVVCAVAVPLFGLLELNDTGAVSYLGARIGFGGLATLTLAASFVNDRVRARLRELCAIQAYALHGWFLVNDARDGMGNGHAIGVMLVASLTVMLFARPAEVVAFGAFTLACTAIGYAGVAEPEVPPTLFAASMVTLIATVGAVNLSRTSLEQALIRARTTLENRVTERTAALAASNERLKAEVEERRLAERAARQANEAKSRFLANMSHELRTPLNAIVGYTEIVQDELRDSAQLALAADLDHVRGSALHLLRMIDDVLDLSNIEAGTLEVQRSPFDVHGLVSHAVARYAPEALAGGNTITMDVPEPLEAVSDSRRVRQIVENLLSNALKFTSNGTVAIVAQVTDTGELVLSVSDTGVGISEDAFGRLFQRFAQLDDSSTRRHGGTGLGLALCRELTVALGGTLGMRSAVGVGTTFTLRIPPSPPTPARGAPAGGLSSPEPGE